MTSLLDLPNFYVKGNKLKEVKPFFHELSPQHIKYVWENKKKVKRKTTRTSNNTNLLILGEFKTDQFFVEKTKLANNLYVENLNHFS